MLTLLILLVLVALFVAAIQGLQQADDRSTRTLVAFASVAAILALLALGSGAFAAAEVNARLSRIEAHLKRIADAVAPVPSTVVLHRFQLVHVNGEDLGVEEMQHANWPVGSVLYRGGAKPNLRVVEEREPGTNQLRVLVMEETRPA